MGRLPHVGSFEDLVVYHKARDLAMEVYSHSQSFPQNEMYSLTSQIRRSSRAIGAQIAEARAKRSYEKHFVSKLTDANAEQQETQHWIGIANDCGYWPPETCADLKNRCAEVGRLLGGMIAKADLFCGPSTLSLREDAPEYFAEPIAAENR